MKNICIIFICFFIISCSSATNNNTKASELQEKINKVTNIQDDSTDIQANGDSINLNDTDGIWLEEEEEIKQRFEVIAKMYPNHSDLMRSIQYKEFVNYIYEIFDKYKEIWNEESEEKNNYLFEKLIPKIVVDNYILKEKISEKESELIIQSIKRNDFNTLQDKNLLTEKFKIFFEETVYNPFIKTLDINEKTPEEKLDMLLDTKNWIIYSILSNRYNWNKTGIWYKPGDMEAEFMVYLNGKMQNIFNVIWVEEQEVQAYAFWKYWVDSLEALGQNILKNFETLVETYQLEGKVPLKRYYRNDERNDIFVDRETVDLYIQTISWNKSESFNEDLTEIRLQVYLLSYFWRNRTDLNEDQWLWSSRTRSDFIHKDFWKWVQNLFRLSRYLPGEKVNISLDNNKS